MEKVFTLNIRNSKIIKSINLSMKLTWTDADDDNTKPDLDSITWEEEDKEPNGIVLQDGILEWLVANLEKPVYCHHIFDDDGPVLVFGTEGDRASFILQWL